VDAFGMIVRMIEGYKNELKDKSGSKKSLKFNNTLFIV
jgi:hypothetical protein